MRTAEDPSGELHNLPDIDPGSREEPEAFPEDTKLADEYQCLR